MDETISESMRTETQSSENAAPQPEQPSGADNPAEKPAPQEKENQESAGEKNADPETSPISDWSGFDHGLGENAAIDPGLYESFGKLAVENGLSPRQAKALISWQLEAVKSAQNRLMEEGAKTLAREWGAKAAENQQKTLSFIAAIDRATGDESFSKALGACGATCHAGIVRGLFAMSRLISESAIGSAAGAGAPEKPETALEGLASIFQAARGELK